MSIESKIIISGFFLVYFVYFLFSKNYVKTYVPFMGIGFLLGPNGWGLLSTSLKEPALFILAPAVFVLGLQMGQGFNRSFWKNFPLYPLIYGLIEKFLLIAAFLTIFFLVIPSFIFMPVSFPVYLSIIAFSSSFFFIQFLAPKIRQDLSVYYRINNLIIMAFLVAFYLLFPLPGDIITNYSGLQKLLALVLLSGLVFLQIKLKIEQYSMIVLYWIAIIFLGSGVASLVGVSPILLGFFIGLSGNIMPIRKRLIFRKFVSLFNEYITIIFLFMAGFLMKISLTILLLGLAYIILRVFSRLILRYSAGTGGRITINAFFKKDIFFLFQGEYFLAFLIMYAIEYQYPQSLTIGLISLVFSELIINYYYYHFVNKKQEEFFG